MKDEVKTWSIIQQFQGLERARVGLVSSTSGDKVVLWWPYSTDKTEFEPDAGPKG